MNNVTVTQLFNLLNERQMSGRHTVLSTNLSMNELLERYTERYTDSETRELFDGMDDSVLRHRYRIHVDEIQRMIDTFRKEG